MERAEIRFDMTPGGYSGVELCEYAEIMSYASGEGFGKCLGILRHKNRYPFLSCAGTMADQAFDAAVRRGYGSGRDGGE